MVEPEVGLPSNADRAALAKILTVVDEYDNCETALDEIQRIAVQTLNEPTPPGGTAGFPTLNISTRSRSPCVKPKFRTVGAKYVHDLETHADPAGDVAAIAFLKDTFDALQARVR